MRAEAMLISSVSLLNTQVPISLQLVYHSGGIMSNKRRVLRGGCKAFYRSGAERPSLSETACRAVIIRVISNLLCMFLVRRRPAKPAGAAPEKGSTGAA